MLKQKKGDDIVRELFSILPEDLRKHKDGVKRNVQAALSAGLSKMELVSREEFDIQAELLSNTRRLVDELTEKVKELEEQLAGKK